VLSREEYEKLKMLEEGHITCEDVLEFVEKARKETAEKILNAIADLKIVDDKVCAYDLVNKLEELAKSLGVEIKE
jgi:hypothetical protein